MSFSLKHILRSPVLLLLLCLSVLLPLAALKAGREVASLPAGYACPDSKEEDTLRFCQYLESMDFIRFDSEAALIAAVEDGVIDCGVLAPTDFGADLKASKGKEVLTLIESPSSRLTALYREQAAAALFSIYAPYITAASFTFQKVSLTEIKEIYYDMLKDGSPFRFDSEYTQGRAPISEGRSDHYFMGALSFLSLITCFFGICAPLLEERSRLENRLARGKVLTSYLLPGLVLRLLFLLAALGLCCILAEKKYLLPALLPAVLCQLGFSLILLSLPGSSWQAAAFSFYTAIGLPLCPIFFDYALLIPVIQKLRLLHPAYSFWAAKAGVPQAMLPAAVLTLLGLGCLLLHSYNIHICEKKDLR